MIRVETQGAVRVVTLDRPAKRNALTVSMLASLADAMRVDVGVRAIVLLGAGSVFCSGFDLRERVAGDDLGALREQLRRLADVVSIMRTGAVPVVVGVQGAAVAGGCALLGGCDVVVAERTAKLGYPVLRLGISPAVTAPFLRAAVGDGACRAMLMDPSLISAERAERIGLVHELVDGSEQVVTRALAIGKDLASKPGVAVASTRRWLETLATCSDATRSRAMQASLDALDDETTRRLEEQVWQR